MKFKEQYPKETQELSQYLKNFSTHDAHKWDFTKKTVFAFKFFPKHGRSWMFKKVFQH